MHNSMHIKHNTQQFTHSLQVHNAIIWYST
jgi:hypothetical protein